MRRDNPNDRIKSRIVGLFVALGIMAAITACSSDQPDIPLNPDFLPYHACSMGFELDTDVDGVSLSIINLSASGDMRYDYAHVVVVADREAATGYPDDTLVVYPGLPTGRILERLNTLIRTTPEIDLSVDRRSRYTDRDYPGGSLTYPITMQDFVDQFPDVCSLETSLTDDQIRYVESGR
jgi:hypothetical protein